MTTVPVPREALEREVENAASAMLDAWRQFERTGGKGMRVALASSETFKEKLRSALAAPQPVGQGCTYCDNRGFWEDGYGSVPCHKCKAGKAWAKERGTNV